MTTVNHSQAQGIHPAAYHQSSDPGSTAAGILWVDRTGSAPFQLKVRNETNAGWDLVGYGPSNTGEVLGSDFSALGLTGATAASRYVGATTSGAPVSGTFLKGDFVIDQTAKIWVCTTAGSPGTWTALTAVTSLTSVTAQLGADVTMASANTYYDGPSVSLAAGTWLVMASILSISQSGTAGYQTAKLWDGSTNAASTEFAASSAFQHGQPLVWIVTPGSTTTYKVSVATTTSTSGKILAAAGHSAAGNTASSLVAVKIA